MTGVMTTATGGGFAMAESVSVADVSRGATGLLHLSNEAYHGGPGISKSHLDVAAKSPAHYWAAYLDPNREPRQATPAMVLGTAIHAAILEPDLFAKQFVIAPDISRRSNAGKAEYDDWIKGNTGREVLTPEQWQVACGARDAVRGHHHASELLKRGQAELSFLGRDGVHDELVKCRTDWLSWDDGLIVDVKSTEDASPAAFIRSVLTYRYHVQQAWYLDVIEQALGDVPLLRWVFLAVEKSPPYAVGLYTLPPAMVAAGRIQARADLARIVHNKLLGTWWDYGSAGTTELEVPPWMQRQLGMNTPEVAFEGTA